MFPLMRIKGKLSKVHRLKLSSYPRYIYLNPIEGVLISYNSVNKFPHMPNYIVKLNDINELADSFQENPWFFKNNMFYLKISTPQKKIYFYAESASLINFWFTEIKQSKKFYEWLNAFIDLRYSEKFGNDKDFSMKADELMNILLGMNLPEIDLDLFQSIGGSKSIEEYAKTEA